MVDEGPLIMKSLWSTGKHRLEQTFTLRQLWKWKILRCIKGPATHLKETGWLTLLSIVWFGWQHFNLCQNRTPISVSELSLKIICSHHATDTQLCPELWNTLTNEMTVYPVISYTTSSPYSRKTLPACAVNTATRNWEHQSTGLMQILFWVSPALNQHPNLGLGGNLEERCSGSTGCGSRGTLCSLTTGLAASHWEQQGETIRQAAVTQELTCATRMPLPSNERALLSFSFIPLDWLLFVILNTTTVAIDWLIK